MPQITDKEIGKVYDGANGEGEYGPYQYYNFYLKGGKLKFSYCHTGKKIVPTEGMKVAFMEWEEKKSGKYTNYNVKTLKVSDNGKQSEPPQTGPDMKTTPCANGKDNPIWFCLSYAKDLQTERMAQMSEIANMSLKDIATEVVMVAKAMLDQVNGTAPKKEEDYPKPAEPDQGDPGPSDEEIPF